MSVLEPKNREEAYAHQFEDDVKLLKICAQVSPYRFNEALGILRTHIMTYLNGTDTFKKIKK